MGILRSSVALTAVLAGGCYSPELRDCTLTCSSASDCADGQLCGADHFCAAPEIAGHCSSLPGDATGSDRDAGVDAPKIVDAASDAATHVALMISIEGQGRASVGSATCDQAAPQNGMCVISVPINQPVTVAATGYPGWRFDKWTTAVCASVPITLCTFSPSAATPVGLKFKKED